jgi:GNAT superfamily N-acetyltransferase
MLTGTGWQAGILLAEDVPHLQVLLESCSDYYEVETGLPPGPSEAHSLYMCLPPEVSTYETKILAGIFGAGADGGLIGVLDAYRDYPGPKEWYIGALILSPPWRRKGLGSAILRAFERWSIPQGAQVVRLAVGEQNVPGMAFLRALGFQNTGSTTMRNGERRITLRSMFREIGQPAPP